MIELNTKKKILEKHCVFKGEKDNPLLAPRGVYFHNNILVVSDTGQNRVFIWKNFSFDEYQNADVILGQISSSKTERNAGEKVNASSLQYPSGVWTNGEKLIVADAWNHRVLIWNTIPEMNFQPADIIVGQMDFESNQPNVEGLGKNCTAHSLYWPYGVYSDGKQLWIADTGNRRVLFYQEIPSENFAAADEVIGQENFFTRDFDEANAVWPYSVKISNDKKLAITDTQFYRVLVWNDWRDALTKKADTVIGQPDFSSSGQNQFQLKPSANTLNWCYDACFFKNGIAIADTGNSRIVIHEKFPMQNNSSAIDLIGQPDFETNGESALSLKNNLDNEMYWPFAVNASNNTMVIADTGNHRILFYK
jgi:hypothetical protein